jgi:cobalt/nickel transport protein
MRIFSPVLLLAPGLPCALPGAAAGHFQVLIPSADVVGPRDARMIFLEALFSHPTEQRPLMEMAPPRLEPTTTSGRCRSNSAWAMRTAAAKSSSGKAGFKTSCPWSRK